MYVLQTKRLHRKQNVNKGDYMSRIIRVSDKVGDELKKMGGSYSNSIERLILINERTSHIEENIIEHIDKKFDAIVGAIALLSSVKKEVETSDQPNIPVTPKETNEQETDTTDGEGFGWTSLEERHEMIRAQEKKVFGVETELNILKKPINEYYNWTKAAEEEKDDPVLHEDDLREAQSVLDDQGVKSIEELEEKLADRINEVQSEYDRESEILLKMRRTK